MTDVTEKTFPTRIAKRTHRMTYFPTSHYFNSPIMGVNKVSDQVVTQEMVIRLGHSIEKMTGPRFLELSFCLDFKCEF